MRQAWMEYTVQALRAHLRERLAAHQRRTAGGTVSAATCAEGRNTQTGRKGNATLGIPTVMDRLIQQALNQVMQPIFDPDFSESSYGFRPGRSAHQAVLKAREYAAARQAVGRGYGLGEVL